MKKPSNRVQQVKFRMRCIKVGSLVPSAIGHHATPGQLRSERLNNKADFGLTPFYFSTINRRSLARSACRFHRKGWVGALGMDWLKSVR